MQFIISYIQLTNSKAIVQDDTENVKNQQQFSEAVRIIKRMNLPASSKSLK